MSKSWSFYNENDPYAAQWLRNLIAAGHIAPGEVDERSIVDVQPDDLKGFTQCHFFAGIGGWSYAARLAGWPDDRELWTGSCPCQPFSVAGEGKGQADERHLWPVFSALISARRPDVVMGEQVAAAVGKHWLDGVHSDLEGIGYACGATVVPACAVDAPHRRDRLWFVADSNGNSSGQGYPNAGRRADGDCARQIAGLGGSRYGSVADAKGLGSGAGLCEGNTLENGNGIACRGGSDDVAHSKRSMCDGRADIAERGSQRRNATGWSGADWIRAADGKARRVEPSIRLLAHGVPARVGKLRAYGNAIVPQVAAEVIGAYLDMERAAA